MVPVGTLSYKESIEESTIDRIFATLLLLESFISYNIEEKFDHDLDH